MKRKGEGEEMRREDGKGEEMRGKEKERRSEDGSHTVNSDWQPDLFSTGAVTSMSIKYLD